MRTPTSEEKRKFKRCDAELVGFEQRTGWRAELPIYRFKCNKHGAVENYEQGYRAILRCPDCDNEYFADKNEFVNS